LLTLRADFEESGKISVVIPPVANHEGAMGNLTPSNRLIARQLDVLCRDVTD
jgi:hypothetical protein